MLLSSARRFSILVLCFSAFASAGTISITGSLNPADPNDVFSYPLTLLTPGTVVFQSWGYGGGTNAAGTVIPPGGFDAYFSLFQGNDLTATFLASNDDGGCPPASGAPNCRDPRLELLLPAGGYILTVTTFGNISFAENYGTGTLADGFVGLGSYFDFDNFVDRSPDFAVDITTGEEIPEMGTFAPVLAALAAISGFRRLGSRRKQ